MRRNFLAICLLFSILLISCGDEIPDETACGNGKTKNGEQCDDGNTVSGDGCSSNCKSETVVTGCTYKGSKYNAGATFKYDCNSCTCNDKGTVVCISKNCDECNEGYVGDDCSECAAGHHIDGDACVKDVVCPTPACSGNGTCSIVAGNPSCACNEGYAGDNCAECTNGYHSDGGVCVKDEVVVCPTPACSGNGGCSIVDNKVSCDCNEGYTAADCSECDGGYAMNENEQCIAKTGNYAHFDIEPGTTVEVGEEVFINASASKGGTLDTNIYEWDFGDGYVHNRGEGMNKGNGGVTVTHFFMKPGTFTIKLKFTDGAGNVYNAEENITVTGVAKKLDGFDLLHASFHGHIAQYITVKIPTSVRSNAQNRLVVNITGDNGYNSDIYDKTALESEEKFLLKNSELPAGKYRFSVKLLDSAGNTLDQINEKFNKPYDGVPISGIDENNAICLNGKPFFPIQSFGLNVENYQVWAERGVINSNLGSRWWEEDLSKWKTHLDLAGAQNLLMSGPVMWPGLPGTLEGGGEKRNADIALMEQYINETKDHSSLLMWSWVDEPDLGSLEGHTTAPVLRSWTYKTNQLDPQRLVYTNFVGYSYSDDSSDWHKEVNKTYSYMYNAERFGGKRTLTTDVFAVDYYPYDVLYNARGHISVEDMAAALDNTISWNGNLAPVVPCIETSGLFDPNTPIITASQLKHLLWVNVIHGAKGIQWFHHNGTVGTSEENFKAMAEFKMQITELTDVVLGPKTDINLSALTTGGRVDTMIRETNDAIYVFAVRVTEPEIEDSAPEITATFTLNAGYAGNAIKVYDESRNITGSAGVFTDSFKPNDVHIYIINKIILP